MPIPLVVFNYATFVFKKIIWLLFTFMVLLYAFSWSKVTLERWFEKPCYNAILPGVQFCLPRDYFIFNNFESKAQEAYNWKTFFLPVDNDIEGANELGLIVPHAVLPILPLDYEDGNHGRIAIELRPMYLSPEQRKAQFEHFKGNKVFKTNDKNTFIHCDQYDHERGNPLANKYCLVKMDWDANITNPRIELSFSIAPQDFGNWRENAEKVRAFLRVYTISSTQVALHNQSN